MSNRKTTVLAFLTLTALFTASHVLADTKYTLLEPLPLGPGGEVVPAITTGEYLGNLFRLIIALSSVIAVFQLIIAGITYMTTDAFGPKSEAKGKITQTLTGLLLVWGSWIIVATILPNPGNSTDCEAHTFCFNLSLPTLPQTPNDNKPVEGKLGGGILPGYTLTPQQVELDTAVRTLLSKNQPPITVNNPPCTTGGIHGCTNVVGLPEYAIGGLKSLAYNCRCSIEITGGTEGGHSDHGPNVGVVDLSPTAALNSYLGQTNPVNGTRVTKGGVTYTYETTGANGRATGNHWHVRF